MGLLDRYVSRTCYGVGRFTTRRPTHLPLLYYIRSIMYLSRSTKCTSKIMISIIINNNSILLKKKLCSVLLLLKMCNKLANLNQQTQIRSHFKLCNLYKINYLCNLITLHIGLFLSLRTNPYVMTYLCNLATL